MSNTYVFITKIVIKISRTTIRTNKASRQTAYIEIGSSELRSIIFDGK
jgi:hypothetical protein